MTFNRHIFPSTDSLKVFKRRSIIEIFTLYPAASKMASSTSTNGVLSAAPEEVVSSTKPVAIVRPFRQGIHDEDVYQSDDEESTYNVNQWQCSECLELARFLTNGVCGSCMDYHPLKYCRRCRVYTENVAAHWCAGCREHGYLCSATGSYFRHLMEHWLRCPLCHHNDAERDDFFDAETPPLSPV